MKKNVGLTYVSEFSFPKEQGFTGSASPSVHQVKGYRRGGHVKKDMKYGEGGYYGKPGDKYPKSKARQKMPKNVKMKGGEVHAQMGGFMGPEREIAVDDVKIMVPKKHGGKMSMHDKLKREGAKMGYAYGGQVKQSNTSAEFKQMRSKQDNMDHGNQPARRGRNQAEIEAGGTKRLKPGLKKGGYMKGGVHQVSDMNKGKGMSKKDMPKNVKAKGGLMQYAQGGYAAGDKMSHPRGHGRKPYSGYNKQPGGSGNEDARYMKKATGGVVKKVGAAQ